MTSRRVEAGAVVAVVLAVLAATAPALGATDAAELAAVSDQLVVGSTHTTDSDFQGGTLQNMSVPGSGDTAQVQSSGGNVPIDTFDDGDISEYSGDTGSATVQSTTAVSGSALKLYTTGSDNPDLFSTSGLNKYAERGDRFSFRANLDTNGLKGRYYLALQGGESFGDGRYGILFDDDGNNLELRVGDSSGSTTTLDTANVDFPNNQFLYVDVDYGASVSDEIVVTVYDDDPDDGGSQLAEVFVDESADSVSTTWDSGGIGWTTFGNTEGNIYYDENLAQTSTSTSGYYLSANHSVSNAEEAAVNVTAVENVSASVAVEYYDGSSWQTGNSTTVSSPGNVSLVLPDVGSSTWRVNASYDRTDQPSNFSVADDSILFTPHAPQASNLSPSDGTKLDSSSVDFTADVSDEEFPTAQGDEVTATLFVDGSSVGSETVSSNQTVTVTHALSDGGDHTYYWELEDSYGETTTTGTQTVTVPATLEIRDVTDTDKLVDADNATVTFYGGENEREIIERDASNGTVSLDDVPTDTEFTVVVRADGYYTRQTIIPSIYDQSNVWMLPKNDTDAVEIVFLLDDRTGDFANSDQTQLRVQRAIEYNNTTEWRDVVGDDISATAELATTLEDQKRYRLVISNDVQTRILGSYTPSGPADPETIPIGRIDFQGDSDQGTAFDAALVNKTQPAVQMMYRDPETAADSLTYRILNTTAENSTVAVANTTIGSPDAFTSVTEPLPAGTTLEDSSYRVELWAYAEDGSLIEKRSASLGRISGPGWGEGVNNGVLTLTGYLLLVGIGYGTGNYSPKLGVLSAVIVGASLTIFNVVAIPHVVLGFTGTIALIVNAADRT